MKILSGSFGAGNAWVGPGKIEIRPDGMFSSMVTIYGSEIAAIEVLGGHASKKMGETVGFGATGAALGSLLGPIGMLAGAAAGALAGGKNAHVTFGCRLTDGRSFVAMAKATEFYEVQSHTSSGDAEPSHSHPDSGSAKKRASRKKGTGRRKKTSKLQTDVMIEGREFAESPEADCPLYSTLKEERLSAAEGGIPFQALSRCLVYVRKLNRVKWRFFDALLEEVDVRHAILLTIAMEQTRASICEEYENACVEKLETADAEVFKLEQAIEEVEKSFSARLFGASTEASRRAIANLQHFMPFTEAEWHEATKRREECMATAQFLIDKFASIVSAKHVATYCARYGSHLESSGDGSRPYRLGTSHALEQLHDLHPKIGSHEESRAGLVTGPSHRDRLLQLKALLDDGLITEDEYATRRTAILDTI